jgi:hypothetical protein
MKNPALATVERDIDCGIVFLKSEKRRFNLEVEEKLQYCSTLALSTYN